jgi:hypothetical protein
MASFSLQASPMERQMPRVVLNTEEQSPRNMPESWGQLLGQIELEAVSRGQVVTEVRFDGVEEPTFWEPTQTGRALGDFQLVEVSTADQSDLLEDALLQGAMAAGTLAAAAIQNAGAFRSADIHAANQQLAELCEGVRSLISLSNVAATAVGLRLDQHQWDGRSGSEQIADLGRQLESISEAQQAQDWLTVADILEYDFHPALNAWLPVFDTLRSASHGSRQPAH